MKRRPTKCLPKHVRHAVARLAAAGIAGVIVSVSPRCYRLDCSVGACRLRCPASLHAGGNAFESLWAAIRALFHARHLPVPA